MRKDYITTAALVSAAAAIVIALAGVITSAVIWHQTKALRTQVASLSASLSADQSGLQKQIGAAQSAVSALASSTKTSLATTGASVQALASRPATVTVSQNDLLTATVAKTAPAVVSIVVSKEVPQLQVTYVNPFGNNPAFQNFTFQIPVYTQTGSSSIQQVAAGTGFLISHDGYILTNKHVVADTNAQYTVLLSNGAQMTGQVTYRDPNNDVALIKIAGTYPTIAALGDSSTLVLGETVVAIGNALGQYNNSVSTGIISGLNRTIQAGDQANSSTETLTGVIQTDAAINLGNSGGPLVDLNGNVVGINVATVVGSNNISFAIPINTVKTIIQSQI